MNILREKLKLMLATSKSSGRLPSEYQEVKYIERVGLARENLCYINTNVPNEIGIECELEVEPTLYNLYQTIIGSSNGMHVKLNQSNYFIVNTTAFNQNGRVTFKCGTTSANRYIEFNGVRTNTSFFHTNNSIFLFAQNNNGVALNGNGTLSSATFYNGKVYSLKITQNNELIRDMIPCYHKTSGVIGMYDLVNDVFYTNQGTGTFTKGNDV